jgi:hypothetical protein
VSSEPLEKILSDELKSGLEIALVDESGELYARVSWINWDSGFRDSALQVQDRIVAVNGVPLTLPADDKARRIARDLVIGGLSESKTFAQMGLNDGSPLSVTVLRREMPGKGWSRHECKGTVRAERAYYTAEGKAAIAPGGPERLGRNEAGDSWMTWLERREFEWSVILDGRWYSKFDSRRELGNHLEQKSNIDAALASYPGEFSKRLAEDWQRVTDSLTGRRVDLPADALEFREQSELIEKQIADIGNAAWAQFLKDNAAVDELPQIDLVRDDRAAIAGKVIAFEGLSWRGAVQDGDHPVFVADHSNYHCFIVADQPAMRTFWAAQAEYQARIEPRLPEKYDVIGQVTPETKLVVTPRSGAKIGLNIEVLAVRVPEHFFADVSGKAKSFAGAEKASARGAPPPPDDASPSDVMRAYIHATKFGDEKLWLALYADWMASSDDAQPYYRPLDTYSNYQSAYTQARNLMLHKVAQVEPAWESDVKTIFKGDEFAGAPRVEQATVIVDHINTFDDGSHVFCTNELTRVWILQRRDGGPWRIVSRNTL